MDYILFLQDQLNTFETICLIAVVVMLIAFAAAGISFLHYQLDLSDRFGSLIGGFIFGIAVITALLTGSKTQFYQKQLYAAITDSYSDIDIYLDNQKVNDVVVLGSNNYAIVRADTCNNVLYLETK
jgi:hypothetical protein